MSPRRRRAANAATGGRDAPPDEASVEHDDTIDEVIDDADDADMEHDDANDADWPPRPPRSRWMTWEERPPPKPIPVEGGRIARTQRGPIGSTWWSRRFLDSLEATMEGGRPARGRAYARKGQVIDLAVRPGVVEAQVQGTRADPYVVRLTFPVIAAVEWDRALETLAAEAGYAARMLAGELPHEIEAVFAQAGADLFPGPGARLVTACTCPDWENPCKHVAAVFYLLAESLDADPFVLLAWRGREREAILRGLRISRGAQRGDATADVSRTPGDQEAGAVAALAPLHESVVPLRECLTTFWKGGPALSSVHVDPAGVKVAGAVLRQLPRGVLVAGDRDVQALLAPAYEEMAAAATDRARDGRSVRSRRRRAPQCS